jgi:hypothetical protein
MSKKTVPADFMDNFLRGKPREEKNTKEIPREHRENTERTLPGYEDFKPSELVTTSIRLRAEDLKGSAATSGQSTFPPRRGCDRLYSIGCGRRDCGDARD